jgi:hypothetical protein
VICAFVALELTIWWCILSFDEEGAYIQIEALPALSLPHRTIYTCTEEGENKTIGIRFVDVPKLIFWWPIWSDDEIGTYLLNKTFCRLFLQCKYSIICIFQSPRI